MAGESCARSIGSPTVNWPMQGTRLAASNPGSVSLPATTQRTLLASMPAALAKAGNMSGIEPPAGLAIDWPSRILGLLEAGVLAAEDRLRRLGIDDRDELDRNLIVGARERERTGIGEAEQRIAGAGLPDGVDRALAAHDLHVEPGLLVVALLERDEEIGVAAVVAEIGDERDVLLRPRSRRAR